MEELLPLLLQWLIRLAIAGACAGIATLLLPRKIPGKLVGLVLIGLAGVFVGQWGFDRINQQVPLNFPWLSWDIQGVPLVPAIVGSLIVLYLVTAFLSWGRYGNR